MSVVLKAKMKQFIRQS